MSAGISARNRAATEEFDAEIIQAIIDTGLESPNDTQSYRLAVELQRKQTEGKTLTAREVMGLYQENVEQVNKENAASGVETAGEYGENLPQNVDMPTVPLIELSRTQYADESGNVPTRGNELRTDAITRAKKRLGLDQNEAAYIEASNVVRNGEEYVLKITKTSLKKMLFTEAGEALPVENIVVMDNLERIANNGVWKQSEGDRQGRQQIKGVDHLITTVYIDGEPHVVDMRVRLVQEAPGKKTDNVLYYFTPEEIVSIEKVDTSSPTAQRHALRIPFGESVSTKQIISGNPSDVNSGAAMSDRQAARNMARVRESATKLGENGSKALAAAYDENMAKTVSPEVAFAGFSAAYHSALTGKPLTKKAAEYVAAIPEQLRIVAEDSGRNDAIRAEQAAYFGEDAGLVEDDMLKKANLSRKTRRVLGAIAKVAGVKVRFTEHIVDENGQRANARYANGVLLIALDAADPVRVAFAHEIVHRMREVSPEAYTALANFVQSNMNADHMVVVGRKYSDSYGTDLDTVSEEMVAQAFGQMLGDGAVLERFVKDNRKPAQKVWDAVCDFVAAIKRALNGQNVKLTAEQKADFAELQGKVEEMAQVLEQALKQMETDVQQHTKDGNKNTASVGGEVKYSLKGYTKDGRPVYETDFGNNLSLNEKIALFKKRIEAVFNLGAVTLKTDVKKIVVNGDKFTVQKNIYGDLARENNETEFEAKINALYDMVDILQRAKFVHPASREPSYGTNIPPKNKAHKNVKYWYKFRTDIVFDGVGYEVTFNIRDKGKNGQYAYLVEFKKDGTTNASNTAVSSLLRSTPSSHTTKIAQNGTKSNPQNSDGKNSLVMTHSAAAEDLARELARIREEGEQAGKNEAEIELEVQQAIQQSYTSLIDEYGAMEPGENPARDVQVPKRTADNQKVSQTVRTILEAKATPDAAVPTIEEMVAKGDFSYESYGDKEAMADAVQAIEDKGYSSALMDWMKGVQDGEVSKESTALGWALYNNAANAGDLKTAMSILTNMVGHQRNAAQALQATRILKKMSPEAQLYGVQRSAQNLAEELKKRYGKEAPDIRVNEELARRYLSARTEAERQEAMRELYRDLGRQMPSRFINKWNAWRYLAMLGNPRTHVRNVLGNAFFAPVVFVKDMTAMAIESAVSRVSGGKLERTKGAVGLGKQGRALLSAAWNDYANVSEEISGGGKYSDFDHPDQYIQEGRRIYGRTEDAKTGVGRVVSGTLGRAAEAARKGNSKALEAEDMWFSRPHYAYALSQYCKAHGITPEMLQAADEGQKKTATRGGRRKPKGIFKKGEATKENPATQEQVNNYVDYALYYGDVKRSGRDAAKQIEKIAYAEIEERAAQELLDEYGIDLWGYWHCLKDNDIRHINNSHGDQNQTEKYPVTADDLKAIPSIVKEYDDILYVPREDGKHGIFYVKRHNGTTYYLEQIEKSGDLINKQMIKVSTGTIPDVPGLPEAINKKWGPISSPNDKVPRMYVQDVWSKPTNTSVPSKRQSVKVNRTLLDRARAYAIKEAQKATYRDTNDFSQFVSKLGHYRGDNSVMKGAGTVVEGILPFRKTPANILARGLEYSPLGILSGIKQATVDVKRGKRTAAEVIDRISAGLTGSGLLGLGIYLAAQGLVRGSGGDDEDKDRFEEMQGHQDYSLELSDGTSITLDWLAPEALPFFVGVNLWEQAHSGEDDGWTMSNILTATANVTEPLLEMSCLQSLNDVFDAVGYASSGELSALPSALASAASSYLSQGMPTIFGQAERTGEDKRMTTYTQRDAFLTSDMQRFIGKTSQKVPGWDYQQIPYIDAWGRTESTGGAAARAGNYFLNPAYVSTVESSPMEDELLRLYEQTGEGSVFPARAEKAFTVDGKRKDLTAQEYVKYATAKGQTAYKVLTALTGSADYRAMSDSEKAEAVELVYDFANAAAKTKVSDYKPEGWVAKAVRTEKDTGVKVEQYVMLYMAQKGIESLKDADGDTITNSRSLLVMEAVYNVKGLTDKQRQALFEDFGVGKSVIHWNKTLVQQKLKSMRKQAA